MTVDQHPGQEQARAIGREAEEPPEPNKKEDVQEDGEAHVQRSGEGDRAAAGEGGAPRPRMAWEPCVTPSAGPNDRAAAAAGCMLPSSLACLGDLSKILNTTTWNESLSEDERQQLRVRTPCPLIGHRCLLTRPTLVAVGSLWRRLSCPVQLWQRRKKPLSACSAERTSSSGILSQTSSPT